MNEGEISNITPERARFQENKDKLESFGDKRAVDLTPEELQEISGIKEDNAEAYENAHGEANIIHAKKTREDAEIQRKEIAIESDKLLLGISVLEENSTKIEKTDIEKNGLALKVLGAKVRNIADRFLTNLREMDDNELFNKTVIPAAVIGAMLAGMNIAGTSDLAGVISILPDNVQHFLQDPKTAGNFTWAIMENRSDISMPSIANYMDQANALQEKLSDPSTQWQGDMYRWTSAMVNPILLAGAGCVGNSIGRILKKTLQQKKQVA